MKRISEEAHHVAVQTELLGCLQVLLGATGPKVLKGPERILMKGSSLFPAKLQGPERHGRS